MASRALTKLSQTPSDEGLKACGCGVNLSAWCRSSSRSVLSPLERQLKAFFEIAGILGRFQEIKATRLNGASPSNLNFGGAQIQ